MGVARGGGIDQKYRGFNPVLSGHHSRFCRMAAGEQMRLRAVVVASKVRDRAENGGRGHVGVTRRRRSWRQDNHKGSSSRKDVSLLGFHETEGVESRAGEGR